MANRCDCPDCKSDSRIRGVLRRGDKKEMRAMIRELTGNLEFMEEELEDAQHFIYHLTHDHDDEQPPQTKHYVN